MGKLSQSPNSRMSGPGHGDGGPLVFQYRSIWSGHHPAGRVGDRCRLACLHVADRGYCRRPRDDHGGVEAFRKDASRPTDSRNVVACDRRNYLVARAKSSHRLSEAGQPLAIDDAARGPQRGSHLMKVLAVDLGGTHATCALVEDRMCVESVVLKYYARGGLEPLLPEIESALDSISQRAAVAKSDLAGVAIAFCGLVDSSAGRILSTNGKFPDATTIDLPAWAEARLGIPLRVENDARMALLGEHYAGAARGVDDVVMITLGTGIGGAAMIEGSLLRGRHFQAGCLGGHLPVSLAGHIC